MYVSSRRKMKRDLQLYTWPWCWEDMEYTKYLIFHVYITGLVSFQMFTSEDCNCQNLIYILSFSQEAPHYHKQIIYTQVSHFLTHHFSCKCQHKYQFYVEFYILKSNYVPKLQINQFLFLSSINHLPKVHENFIISWKSQARVQTWVFTWAYISITLQQPWM